jgi:hypothetical protein
MQVFKTVTDYMKAAKVDDIIVLNEVAIGYKYDTYKVTNTTDKLTFKAYRSSKNLATHNTAQKVTVLSRSEFNNLRN